MAFFHNFSDKRKNYKVKQQGSKDKDTRRKRFNKYENEDGSKESYRGSSKSYYGNDSKRTFEKKSFKNNNYSKSSNNERNSSYKTNKGEYRNSYKSHNRSFDNSFEDTRPSYLKYEYENNTNTVSAQEENQVDENILVGRNPIREALKSDRDIEKILVSKGDLGGSASEIIAKARAKKITVQEVEKRRLDNISKHHQGIIAYASAYKYHTMEDILRSAEEKGETPFVVMLDGITDPHNLGAIIRSAECAGAHGVIIPARRSAGLTATAVKSSAGAVEHIMVAKVTNLSGAIESLKRKGLWVYAADMDGEDYTNVNFEGPVLLVIGSEGSGISKLVLENCDKTVSIPLKGKIDSLNASVASGILLFQIAKGR